MKMQCKKIIGLPVQTESGEQIGKVSDIHLSVETHDVQAYIVSTGRLLRSVVGAAVIEIVPVHVRSIQQDKMIVADLYSGSDSKQSAQQKMGLQGAGLGVAPIAAPVAK